MADWENRLGQESPLSRALRLAMPEDLRNPLLHPEAVNHFALPPQQPRAELRNLPPRPGDYLSPVSEALSPTMGAYGLGNALGDAYVKGREGDYKGMASPLAEILLSMAPVPGMKKGAMPPRVENPIRAYHGSPYDFDKFDLSKIGTGEGAQAYGHGLYLAENEGVARSYRDTLSADRFKDGTTFNLRDPAHWAADALREAGGDRAKAAELLNKSMTPDLKAYEGDHYQRLLRAKGMLERGEPVPEMGKGHMYEVAIHATPDQFLDWDKPLSQQSEAVQKWYNDRVASGLKTREIGVNPNLGPLTDVMHPEGGSLGVFTPDRLPDVLSNPAKYAPTRGEDLVRAGHEQALREAGIPGIRYLDQGSRGAGQGTHNLVVFDPSIIEILRKYGLLGPVAAGATANALMGDKDQQ